MKSDKEWVLWGKADPLFAVSSWPGREKGGANPWTNADFYALGESDWNDFLKRWDSYGINTEHVLEIGCGAGRITRPLTKFFKKVTATDVSPEQINLAKKALPGAHVNFLVSDGTTLAAPNGAFSAVFSCHVFQHFDSLEDALAVFREVHRVLRSKGTLCVHLPLIFLPRSHFFTFFQCVLKTQKILGNLRARFRRLLGRPLMRNLFFEGEVLRINLIALGFVDIEFHGFYMKSNGGFHPLVLASKT